MDDYVRVWKRKSRRMFSLKSVKEQSHNSGFGQKLKEKSSIAEIMRTHSFWWVRRGWCSVGFRGELRNV